MMTMFTELYFCLLPVVKVVLIFLWLVFIKLPVAVLAACALCFVMLIMRRDH